MKNAFEKKSIGRIGTVRRKAVSLSREGLITVESLEPGQPLPLVIKPSFERVSLPVWAKSNQELITTNLSQRGAILFRGFDISTPAEFEQFIRTIAGEPLEYGDQSSPRHKISGNIYSSTDHPADQSIFPHNENSYSHVWPMKIFFFCVTPADERGGTPIVDVRRLLQRVPAQIVERFVRKHWMLVRNFAEGIGLSWETVFQTSSRKEVEDYCRRAGIEVEWRNGGGLRTRQVRQAVARHPRTGEMVWFNHATFFHISTLEPNTRQALLEQFREDDLPYNTYYGDGTPIEPYVLEELRQAYQDEATCFPWMKGDLLMLDNMLTAHGREPFTGPRKVLVGMAEPFTLAAAKFETREA